MLSRDWKIHPELLLPEGFVEDPVLYKHLGESQLFLYYCRGDSFQNQRLYRRPVDSPLGPVGPEQRVLDQGVHTRLYRARLSPGLRIVSQVWPGLPRVGLWVHKDFAFGEARTLLVAPKPGTLYSIAACNPWAQWDERLRTVDILFEGRNDRVAWRLFHARWTPASEAPAIVIDEPILDGILAANPSVYTDHDAGLRYLTFSAPGDHGQFETRVATQPVVL